jgi:hypothetical protein
MSARIQIASINIPRLRLDDFDTPRTSFPRTSYSKRTVDLDAGRRNVKGIPESPWSRPFAGAVLSAREEKEAEEAKGEMKAKEKGAKKRARSSSRSRSLHEASLREIFARPPRSILRVPWGTA